MTAASSFRPGPADCAPHHLAYIALVPDGDVLAFLSAQGRRTQAFLAAIDERQGGHRYAEGKWTVKQVVQHVIDGERMFAYRALCFARGDEGPLPSFDGDGSAANDGSGRRRLPDLAAELAAVRAATLTLFEGLDEAAWARRGVASGKVVAVRALPWILAGHELHHLAMLRDQYGVGR